MTWVQISVLHVLTRHKSFRSSAFLNGPVPFESLVQIIIHNEAHGHNMLIIDLGNHVDQLRLELRQSPE